MPQLSMKMPDVTFLRVVYCKDTPDRCIDLHAYDHAWHKAGRRVS